MQVLPDDAREAEEAVRRVARSATEEARIVLRARIVVERLSEDRGTVEVARVLGVTRQSVAK